MSRLSAGFLVFALAASPAFAQATASTNAARVKSDSKSEEQKRDEAALEKARAHAVEGQAVNTRIDLTIVDARGEGTPITKTVSVMTSDRSWGRIRTQGEARTPNGQRFPVILNVDAHPTLVGSGGASNRARVELTIEYRPADEVAYANSGVVASPRRDPDSITPNINESLSVILEDGKSLVISQSADPVTDRTVKVEAKLTILK